MGLSQAHQEELANLFSALEEFVSSEAQGVAASEAQTLFDDALYDIYEDQLSYIDPDVLEEMSVAGVDVEKECVTYVAELLCNPAAATPSGFVAGSLEEGVAKVTRDYIKMCKGHLVKSGELLLFQTDPYGTLNGLMESYFQDVMRESRKYIKNEHPGVKLKRKELIKLLRQPFVEAFGFSGEVLSEELPIDDPYF